MSAKTLAEYLRQKNPTGLPYEDAMQLFLWMYCSIDVVPDAFRSEDAVSKAALVRTFEELTRSGFIRKPTSTTHSPEIPWPEMVDALLSNRVQPDWEFRTRIGQFL